MAARAQNASERGRKAVAGGAACRRCHVTRRNPAHSPRYDELLCPDATPDYSAASACPAPCTAARRRPGSGTACLQRGSAAAPPACAPAVRACATRRPRLLPVDGAGRADAWSYRKLCRGVCGPVAAAPSNRVVLSCRVRAAQSAAPNDLPAFCCAVALRLRQRASALRFATAFGALAVRMELRWLFRAEQV